MIKDRGSNIKMSAVYYVPTIPEVYSTDRYQHALAITEHFENSYIISNNCVPTSISKRASSVTILSSQNVRSRGYEAASTAKNLIGGDGLFITSYHYEATLAGFLADKIQQITSRENVPIWVIDVYETPAQYRLNNPRSYHQVTSLGLGLLLKTAPYGIHSVHPTTPYQYGSTRLFINNGAPVKKTNPTYKPESTSLNIVWVGSPRADRGGTILIEALKKMQHSIKLDIYGELDRPLKEDLGSVGDHHNINHHGHVDHDICLRAIESADVGYCVLPPRKDWKYAPPIKVGEYLAGGTIPLISQLPGMVQIATAAGWYVQPTGKAIARALDKFVMMNQDSLISQKKIARKRAEEIRWESIRSEFATQLKIIFAKEKSEPVISLT